MKTPSFVVAGTGTQIGKTLVSSAFLHCFARMDIRAAAIDPLPNRIYTRECPHGDHGLSQSRRCPQLTATPLCESAIELRGTPTLKFDIHRVAAAHRIAAAQEDVVIVEGVGGFEFRAKNTCDTISLASTLGLPIVLVAGIKLGCISRALFGSELIVASRLELAGWVANLIDPDLIHVEQAMRALHKCLDAPLLGMIPHVKAPKPAWAANYLDGRLLLDRISDRQNAKSDKDADSESSGWSDH